MMIPDKCFDRFKGPEEDKTVTTDWRGGEVYSGDEYILIDGDIVLRGDLEEYAVAHFGKVEIA